MPANRRISPGQMEELVGWMEAHPLQARGTQLKTPQAKQTSHRLWEELASRLNSIGCGATKTLKEWRQYWSDQKCRVRKKGSLIRDHASSTGGGPPLNGILTPIEERILSLMGVQNVLGNESVRIPFDMGLNDSPAPPVSPPALPLATFAAPPSAEPPASPAPVHPPSPSSATVAARPPTDLPESTPAPVRLPTPSSATTVARPRRKHTAVAARQRADVADRPYNIAPPQWVLRMEASQEVRKAEALKQKEKRWEEKRVWRADILNELKKLTKLLSRPPPPP